MTLILCLTACGGGAAKGPTGPTWTVTVNACGDEARAANHERVMDTTPDRRGATVFAYAECERRRLEAKKVTTSDVADYADDIQHARGLYWEAFQTHESRWEIGALTRIGELYDGAATKLDALGDEKLDSIVIPLREQAAQAYEWALIHADRAETSVLEEPSVVAWLSVACNGLKRAKGSWGGRFCQ